MVFLQLHTFYPQYLRGFYASNAGLEEASFEQQMSALVEDGFAAGHMLPTYLRKLGWDAYLAIANCPQAQLQWTREHRVSDFTEENWHRGIARHQVETIKPDVLYLSDPISFDDSFISALTWKPRLIVGWRAASIPAGIKWSRFDLILSHLQVCRQRALELGASSVEHFHPGMSRGVAERVKNEAIVSDVTFTGQWTAEHKKRNDILLELARASADKNPAFSFGLYLACQTPTALPPEVQKLNRGPKWGLDMFRALRSGVITINAEIDLAAGEAGNMRLFEATGTGRLLITEHQKNIERYFECGREIETFHSSEELIEKIRFYVGHPKERDSIALRGQERCLRDYSMEKQAFEFNRIIHDYLGRKSGRGPTHFSGMDAVNSQIITALECLNANDCGSALHQFDEIVGVESSGSQIHFGRAVALARLGRISEAVHALKNVLAARPDHRKAKLLLEELCASADKQASANTDSNENGGLESTGQLMEKAVQALKLNQLAVAFESLNRAKALKQSCRGLDYYRAICFLQMNQVDGAREALREELRYFPDHLEARELLNTVLTKATQISSGAVADSEFHGLLQTIRPYTMLGEARLFSLFTQAKNICLRNRPGNFVECGVAAGGSTALLAYVVKRYSKQPRRVFAFDSFDGMPEPSAPDRHKGISANVTGWGTGTCAATEDSVKEICSKLGVADVVVPIKGYFQETLVRKRDWVGMISLLHLDGDWYESTKAILDNLYDRVLDDGVLQVDDYGYWEGCKKALHEFASSRGLSFKIEKIDETGIWFAKPDRFSTNAHLSAADIESFGKVDPVNYEIPSQMSSNERFQLFYALEKFVPKKSSPVRFVEIGSFAGGSLFLTYNTLKKTGCHVQGFAVEPGGQPHFYQVLQKSQPDVLHLRMLSHDAAPKLLQHFRSDGNYPAFIFIDGDHSYEGVRQDILAYHQMLAPGGILMLHDYLPPLSDTNREAIYFHHANKEPGIRRACQELLENTLRWEVVEIPLLRPSDLTQTQAYLPIIRGVYSTIRAYRKPNS